MAKKLKEKLSAKQKTPTLRLDPNMVKRINSMLVDFSNFKVRTGHKLIDLEKRFLEIRQEVTNLTKYFAAILDLLSDTSNVPGNVIMGRFMQYCSEHEIIDNFGNVSGAVNVSKYNFAEE